MVAFRRGRLQKKLNPVRASPVGPVRAFVAVGGATEQLKQSQP